MNNNVTSFMKQHLEINSDSHNYADKISKQQTMIHTTMLTR